MSSSVGLPPLPLVGFPANQILLGDALVQLRTLPSESVQTIVTSPPYWGLRDYGIAGQIGLEPTLPEFIAKLVDVFHEARRVLRDDGTLWLNIGDGYTRPCGQNHKVLRSFLNYSLATV